MTNHYEDYESSYSHKEYLENSKKKKEEIGKAFRRIVCHIHTISDEELGDKIQSLISKINRKI